MVRTSARLCELITKPRLLISCGFYACQAACIPNIIRFSIVRPPFDIMLNMLLVSVIICTGICCLKTSSHCLRISSASSNRSAKAITSVDSTERATRRDLYDLYETGIALCLSSVKRTMRSGCDNKLT